MSESYGIDEVQMMVLEEPSLNTVASVKRSSRSKSSRKLKDTVFELKEKVDLMQLENM
jgi:hypothetical protein